MTEEQHPRPLEQQLRRHGLRQAPASLVDPVMRYARNRGTRRRVAWLDARWVWRVAGFVPLLDWVLLAVALLRGQTVRLMPIVPGLTARLNPGLNMGERR